MLPIINELFDSPQGYVFYSGGFFSIFGQFYLSVH
jgi:hypothetical protein